MSISKAGTQGGITLIEQIFFIVVVSIAMVGVLAVLNTTSRSSADTLVRKQALAIAEAVLEEVQLMSFTYCDPDDPQAATALSSAVSATGCTETGSVENIGAESTVPYGPETRTGASTPFDNVSDYHGFSMAGMSDINGATITGLDAYAASVSVAAQGVAAFGGKPAIVGGEALLITVTVTGPADTTIVLHGYRMRYAPNALP
jgi:MSHA pilin protein MshD